MEIAKDIPELYPDLIEQGSLANALQAALRKIGSSLSISDLQKSVSFIVYARVSQGIGFRKSILVPRRGCSPAIFGIAVSASRTEQRRKSWSWRGPSTNGSPLVGQQASWRAPFTSSRSNQLRPRMNAAKK